MSPRSLFRIFFLSGAIAFSLLLPVAALAGNIDVTNKYARFLESGYGQINFGTTEGDVTVGDSNITGYAWSEQFGWINLNPTNGGVANDGNGTLTGYAWGEGTGWVNFNPTNGGVTIDSAGDFHGYAWSELRGWIVFNCATDSSCGTLDHKVSTSWIPINARPVCNNTLDDDSDGLIDYPADGGCTSTTDTDEAGPFGGGPAPSPPPPSPPPSEPPPSEPPPSSGGGEPPPEGSSSSGSGGGGSGAPAGGGSTPPPSGGGGGAPSGGGAPPPAEPPPLSFFPAAFDDIAETLAALRESVSAITRQIARDAPENIRIAVAETARTVREAQREVTEALSTPEGEVTSKAVITTGVVTGGTTSLLSLLFTPFSVSELALMPIRLWGLFLSALGIKRRHRPWGAVYDSVTKQPLDPAYVTLEDTQGKEIASAITDLDGRYGFLAPPGIYRIVANKTNYRFPSTRLAGKENDEFYRNLYFGEPIIVPEGGAVVTRDIPLDPEGFDWNEYAKRAQGVMKFYSRNTILIERTAKILFAVGFLISAVALVTVPEPYNIAIFALYVLVWLLRKLGPGERPHGVIIEKGTNAPASFAFVNVLHPETGMEVRKSVADVLGRYYCLVPKGTYRVGITLLKGEGNYISSDFSTTVNAKRGVIRKKFEV